MKVINKNGLGVCFVIDKNDSLKGIATDGDIRRAILNHKDLSSPIGEIINNNFVYGHINEPNEVLVSKITNNEVTISILPIVDNNHKLVDYFRYSPLTHFPVAMPNLAGNEFKYLTDAFLSTWISSKGPYLDLFEESFASYSDCKYGISVSNGTVAIHVALVALGIGEGDEVICARFNFCSDN